MAEKSTQYMGMFIADSSTCDTLPFAQGTN
jgi:hypothetical protein